MIYSFFIKKYSVPKSVQGNCKSARALYHKQNIQTFKTSFLALGLSVTPKVHAVFRHVQEFCERNGCGLSVFSEQVIEACHYDFFKIEQCYSTNLDTDPHCGEKVLNALNRYNLWIL